MLQAFETVIKPLNDQLGESLNMKRIKVEDDSFEEKVYVKVAMTDYHGLTIFAPQYMVGFYQSLGLVIGGRYE
jgi:hypothetical protein